ncbi:hypothetical protein [Cytobacillus kochii]|nr:hypothetical protein [Cytobacillus kochii]MCM3347207.1 hypothetical protein [Cytobacillus kochii]
MLVLCFTVVSYANASEIDDTPIENTGDPVTESDGMSDGENDHTTINRTVTKISDDPYYLDNLISPFGAGEWDYLGSSTFKSKSAVFYSGGGNFRVWISQPHAGPGFKWSYRLMEDDPVGDDQIDRFDVPNSAGTYQYEWNVRSFVDGDNKKAEIYLHKMTMPTYSVTVDVWD